MEQKIITSGTAQSLNQKIADAIKEGWEPVGAHQAVEIHHQNRYAGTQLMDTRIEVEYSQTLRKS